MSPFEQQVSELNTLVQQGKFEEALDKFYDENVISVENESEPANGLTTHRAGVRQFTESLSNFSATPLQVILSNNMSVTEWHYVFDHALAGHFDYKQLSLQRWKNGKVVHERHHYERD